MSLTDDWRAGRIKIDYPYFIKLDNGKVEVSFYHINYSDDEGECWGFDYGDDDIVEVLAPCDYEELQDLKESCHQLKNSLDFAIQANEKALQENALLQIDINRLKEALNIELLSSRIHTIWSNWFLHQRDLSTEDNLARWNKQAHTRYEDLSDADKEKDRKIVKNLLARINEVLK